METLVLILGGILALIGAFFAGNKRGEGKAKADAKEEVALDKAHREAAGSKAVADAAEVRRDVEQEVRHDNPNDARADLRVNWTRRQ